MKARAGRASVGAAGCCNIKQPATASKGQPCQLPCRSRRTRQSTPATVQGQGWFADAPKALLEKIELVVRLVRSKGVGIFFVTQNPLDIPETVLGQLPGTTGR
jgi:hypothetical protein